MVGRTWNLIDQGHNFPIENCFMCAFSCLTSSLCHFRAEDKAWSWSWSWFRILHYSSVHIISSYFMTQTGGTSLEFTSFLWAIVRPQLSTCPQVALPHFWFLFFLGSGIPNKPTNQFARCQDTDVRSYA